MIGDSSLLEAVHDVAYQRWKSEAPFAAIDEEFQTLWKSEPELFLTEDTNVLGGYPMWLQERRSSRFPFFLQLVTDGDVMIGDGGHLYLFLDPDAPELGFDFFIQMY